MKKNNTFIIIIIIIFSILRERERVEFSRKNVKNVKIDRREKDRETDKDIENEKHSKDKS